MTRQLHALIVEDSAPDAALVVRALGRDIDIQWERVDTESEYLACLERDAYEVVLSDYRMPRFSAPRALELLLASGRDLPFIVISGTIGEETAVEIMRLGADDYLLKDRLTRLPQAVLAAIERRRERREREAVRRLQLAVADALVRSQERRATLRAYADALVSFADAALVRIWTLTEESDVLELQASAGLYEHLDGPHSRVRLGSLEIGRIAKLRQPHVSCPLREDPLIDQEWARSQGLVAFAGYPLLVDDRCLGVIAAFARHEWSGFMLDALASVASQLAMGEQRRQAEESLRRAERRLATQYEVSRQLSMCHTYHEAAPHVLRALCKDIGWEVGAIWEVGESLTCVAVRAPADAALEAFVARTFQFQPRRGVGLVGGVWESGKADWTVDVGAFPDYARHVEAWRAGLKSALAFPIMRAEQMVGILELYSRDALLPDTHILDTLMSVCDQMAVFIEQRRVQKELAESERRFRQMAENLGEVFWLSTIPIRDMLYISPAYERVFARSCQSMYANPASFLEALPPPDRQTVLAAIENLAETGHFDLEHAVVRPDGEVRTVRVRCFAIHDDAGKLYRMAGMAQDITESKALESRYLQAQKMEAVGQLAGGVAHDFNNVLTAVIGYGDMLAEALAQNDPLREYVTEMLSAASRAVSLTRQLLAFSRKQIFEVRLVDVGDLVHDMQNMVGRLIGEHIALKVVPPAKPCLVKADPGQLEQVLLNLAVNARDAMPKGGKLTIELGEATLDAAYAASQPDVAPGHYVVLSVSDTGGGISDAIKARIFEPFFTTKEQGKGTGLGLSTCFGIVKQSGGHITVYSEVGKGTVFKVYLPASDGEAAARAGSASSAGMPRGNETVLVVEDEEPVRRLATLILSGLGYRVLSAADGQDALEVAAALGKPIDLVVTDVVMPRLGGREMAEVLATRTLFCSGYTDDAIVHHGVLDAGVAFLQKPYTPTALAAKVREVLDA
jgi:PAS domain S-box-containing protein